MASHLWECILSLVYIVFFCFALDNCSSDLRFVSNLLQAAAEGVICFALTDLVATLDGAVCPPTISVCARENLELMRILNDAIGS